MVTRWTSVYLSVCPSVVCLSVRCLFPDDITSVNIEGFSCALILWKFGFGLLMGKFRKILTELSACIVGYYSLTLLFNSLNTSESSGTSFYKS